MEKTFENRMPAVFHITHWKAGSQWIRAILCQSFPDLVVIKPEGGFPLPIQEGKVYPCIFSSLERFNSVVKLPVWYSFIIIRDLRDALIS